MPNPATIIGIDLKINVMAKNAPTGDNRRIGAVKDRTQVQNPNGHWTKRGPDGKFMDVKHDHKPFKGVTKEK